MYCCKCTKLQFTNNSNYFATHIFLHLHFHRIPWKTNKINITFLRCNSPFIFTQTVHDTTYNFCGFGKKVTNRYNYCCIAYSTLKFVGTLTLESWLYEVNKGNKVLYIKHHILCVLFFNIYCYENKDIIWVKFHYCNVKAK